ncbi:C2 calcium-dependent membrane targeting and RhoGAP domain containing protein [Aphelenchoides bicaudatus]|nr:C2 calcium-dependent membrane targeting and RhoGAP domain containing protein [Aphelenchoides bicaudatus]
MRYKSYKMWINSHRRNSCFGLFKSITFRLATQGSTSFTARVLDRAEYPADGNTVIVQLVEIIKKPGQSLGLYLREGNGIDRFSGVFASRFGEGSELERMGNIIRPGDEILNVNNVEVQTMSIDDVVYALSIPRRLLLRTRFLKNHRDFMDHQPSSSSAEKPVIIFQKDKELENRRSSITQRQGILSKPVSTASTWLGKRVRQQQKHDQHERQAFSQQFSVDAVNEPMRNKNPPPLMTAASFDAANSVTRTAYIPPPRIQTTRDYMSGPSTAFRNQLPYSSATLGRPTQSQVPVSSSYSAYNVPQRRPFPMPVDNFQTLPYGPLLPPPPQNPYHATPSTYKSNSLPRRRIQSEILPVRTVKWRNDVIDPNVAGLENEDPLYTDRSAFSDIGAVSSPRTPRRYDMTMRANSTISSPGTVHRPMTGGRSVMEIFSSQEYRNWATLDPSQMNRMGNPRLPRLGVRSSSLPSKTCLNRAFGTPSLANHHQNSYDALVKSQVYGPAPLLQPDQTNSEILDRLHLSPLVNRRVPLRAAGPGFDIDSLSINSLTGMISIWILEGRNLRVPDKMHSNQLYVVIEIDDHHRARTGISTPEQKFRWREGFEIDVHSAVNAQFFVYSWHPQLRHRFCHKANMRLVDAFFVDQLNGVRVFALNLEPRGQLMIRVAFTDIQHTFRRTVNTRYNASFAVPLQQIVQREQKETPVAFTRLINEIERRGVDSAGLYYLSGAMERKNYIKEQLNRDAFGTDLSINPIPDINLLTCLVKDFLRELPEPLIPLNIYTMLVDASAGLLPSDREGNQGIMLKIVDCMAPANRNTLLVLIDHLKNLIASEPHNGLTILRATTIFGPLVFCTNDLANVHQQPPKKVDLLDASQAANTLRMLIENWPSRNSSSSDSTAHSTPQSVQQQRTQTDEFSYKQPQYLPNGNL